MTLKIHAWNGYVLEYIDAYKKYAASDYGLDVNVVYTSTSGYESHVGNIRAGAQADVISPSTITLSIWRKTVLLSP